MASAVYNHCADTATAPGTGTLTLLGAVPTTQNTLTIAPLVAFRTATSKLQNGDTVDALFVDASDRTIWEAGTACTYTTSGTTLTRGTRLESSTGSAVNFTGAVNVYITLNVGGLLLSSGGGQALAINSTLIDMGTAGDGYSVTDLNIGATPIANTSKPGSPDYTYTVLSLPTSTHVLNWQAVFTIYGQNTDSTTRTINWRFTLNGTDIGSGDSNTAPTTNNYWCATGLFALNALAVNDVLGIKLWASATNVVNFIGATVYETPRVYAIPTANAMAMVISPISSTLAVAPSGALSGVTYANVGGNASSQNIGIIDTGVQTNPFGALTGLGSANGSPSSAMVAGQQSIFAPQAFTFHIGVSVGAFADNNAFAQTSGAAATLHKLTPSTVGRSNTIPRYFRQWTFST